MKIMQELFYDLSVPSEWINTLWDFSVFSLISLLSDSTLKMLKIEFSTHLFKEDGFSLSFYILSFTL
jgi:hypothetical protein